jgi:hypothetical protein
MPRAGLAVRRRRAPSVRLNPIFVSAARRRHTTTVRLAAAAHSAAHAVPPSLPAGAMLSSQSALLSARVRPQTAAMYSGAVCTFLHWCELHFAHTATRVLQDMELLQELLPLYFNYVHSAQGSRHHCSLVFHGLRHFLPHRLSHRDALHFAFEQLRGWERADPSEHHPALTWPVTVALAATMAKAGHGAAAVATMLAFDCYLRVNEMAALHLADVALPGDPRLGVAYTTAALRLATTKRGQNQFVCALDARVSAVFVSWLQRRWGTVEHIRRLVALDPESRGPNVFGFATAAAYRHIFDGALLALRLDDVGYVPHSLRGGGATRDFLAGYSLETVLFRGRWESTVSARTYIQSARARLLLANSHSLPAASLLGAQLDAVLVKYFERFVCPA